MKQVAERIAPDPSIGTNPRIGSLKPKDIESLKQVALRRTSVTKNAAIDLIIQAKLSQMPDNA